MWILRAGSDGAAPPTFRVGLDGTKTIGRSPGADFRVDAALLSRLHCRLTATHERLLVEDLESTNGTFVNGRRVRSASLAPGDRLRVGTVELIVEWQD